MFGPNELYLAFAFIAGFTICWSVLWFALRNKTQVLEALFANGNLLRMMAIIFVVVTVLALSVTRTTTPEAIAVLSGIAGYVLGGVQRTRTGAER